LEKIYKNKNKKAKRSLKTSKTRRKTIKIRSYTKSIGRSKVKEKEKNYIISC